MAATLTRFRASYSMHWMALVRSGGKNGGGRRVGHLLVLRPGPRSVHPLSVVTANDGRLDYVLARVDMQVTGGAAPSLTCAR